MLPQLDQAFLDERHPNATVQLEASMICVVIPMLELPRGLTVTNADLLLRLAAGYPDVAPDMWWFSPAVKRADGGNIAATEVSEVHLGRSWQRWSRHLNAGQWRSGIDCLESYLALVQSELRAAAKGIAA